MKLYYKIKIQKMKLSISILLFIFIGIISSCAQVKDLSTWYPLKAVKKNNFSHNIAAYNVTEAEAKLSNLPKNITQVEYSALLLSRGDGSATSKRSNLFGCRGQINNREVLILDVNLDRDISDNEIIYLPELKLVDSIIYNGFYLYPSDFNQLIEVEYDHIVNNQAIKIPHSFMITVLTKFDTTSLKLYYTDTFKADHLHKLRSEISSEATSFAIETDNHLPWQSTYRFTLEQNGLISDLVFKEKFSVSNGQSSYFIDSIDIINRRILISKANKLSSFTISGTPLNSETFIDTKFLKNDTTLIHFWGTWCEPCIRNMPIIKDIHSKYKNLGIIGVAVSGGETKTLDFIKNKEMIWPNFYFENEEKLLARFNFEVLAFPTYILIDKDNNILGRWTKVDDLMKALKYN